MLTQARLMLTQHAALSLHLIVICTPVLCINSAKAQAQQGTQATHHQQTCADAGNSCGWCVLLQAAHQALLRMRANNKMNMR
jgi:hypothetical protein